MDKSTLKKNEVKKSSVSNERMSSLLGKIRDKLVEMRERLKKQAAE